MSAYLATSTVRTHRAPATRRHLGLLVFVWVSFLVIMSITQEDNIEQWSLSYWLLIIPAAALPMLDLGLITRALLGRAKLLAILLVAAGTWHLIRGDMRAVLQLGLLVLGMAWISTERAVFDVQDLLNMFLALIILGFLVYAVTDINKWGLIPGETDEEFGIWRVSFFPNIANTACLALVVLLLLTRDRATAFAHPVVFAIALYFMVFSFVRTALLAGLLYVALRWYFGLPGRALPARMFWVSLVVAFGVNIAIATSPLVVNYLQELPLFSRLLLRGETGLTPDEIFEQVYRPWLWWQHLTLFASSPSLMGLGSFDFFEMKTEELLPGHTGAGSEALLTRLLATYGLPGLLFTAFLIVCLRARANANDRWSCACFPAILLMIMNWGSVFHPTSAFFALFLLMIVRGTDGFSFTASAAGHRAARTRTKASTA